MSKSLVPIDTGLVSQFLADRPLKNIIYIQACFVKPIVIIFDILIHVFNIVLMKLIKNN